MSRAFRTSPEVADLIRAVESADGWSTRQGPKVVQFLHPDGEQVIRLGNTADAGDVRMASAALTKFGVLSSTGTKSETVTETVTVRRDEQEWVDPYPQWTVFEKAKKVWKNARDYAVATGKSLMEVGGVEFYLIDDRPMATFIARVLPKIKDHYPGPGGTREVYDFLRATGNCVRENLDDETSLWVVRTTWSDEGADVIIRNPRKAVSDYEKEQQRKERKLREEEVSQRLRAPQDDLDVWTPLPVVIGSMVRYVADDTLWQVHALLSDKERSAVLHATMDNQRPRTVTAKELAHLYVIVRFTIEEPAVQTIETTQDPVVLDEPGNPKVEVQAAFQMLSEAMDTFMAKAEPNEALISELAALGTQLAEVQQEVAFLRADNEVQKSRADRAEEVIACIRLAFDTQPMHQAAASTIDLLPPNKD